MKKLIALLVSLIAGANCFTGCAKNDEAPTPKRYTAESGEIAEVCIDVRDRQVEVTLSNDNRIHIDYFEDSKEFYEISVSDRRTLSMTAANNKEWTDYIGGKSAADSRKISLQVPDELLETLKISTTNEDISLPPLTVTRDLSLSSHGGNISFDRLNVGKSIFLDAKNGDISGTITGSYDDYAIACSLKKGESNLPPDKESGTKALTAINNNGDIHIAFIRKPASN